MEITLECLPETMSIEGNVLASGLDWQDQQAEAEVYEQLANGNDWAWCMAKVTVTSDDGRQECDYLGGCSYKNEEDFKTSGYYQDMIDHCSARLGL